MSDAVTNTEIEDVLTSIRRLVSENRPLAGAEKGEAPARAVAFDASLSQDEVAEESPAVAEAPLALVLTPALRVEDAPKVEADDDEAALPQNADAAIDLDVEEVVSVKQTDCAVDEVEAEVVESADVEFEQISVENKEDTPEITEADQDDVMAEVASEGAEGEPEEDTPLAFDAVSETTPEETIDEEQPFDFQQVLEARIHQFRDATSTEDVTYEPETDVAPNFADAVMDELSVTMPDEIAETMQTVDAEALSNAMEETAEIDEAMLREMVADIVRQELQGALGERITRNVRKLVRREIHRALAAHDLG